MDLVRIHFCLQIFMHLCSSLTTRTGPAGTLHQRRNHPLCRHSFMPDRVLSVSPVPANATSASTLPRVPGQTQHTAGSPWPGPAPGVAAGASACLRHEHKS